MNLLFRLTVFENRKEVKNYFMNKLPNENKYYFYDTVKRSKLKLNDTFYFSYKNLILFSAKYIDYKEDITNYKYPYGYKLTSIKQMKNISIDANIFKTNTIYLTEELQKELDKLIG